MESPSTPKDSNGILLAPAPWKLKCRSWIFLTSPLKSNKVSSAKAAVFPAGWAAPFEYDALEKGEFVGGPGMVMLVQYSESPVGPDDELMWIAGKFSLIDVATGKAKIEGNRITRIYVSTKESTANGRRNWNIPKQVAHFNYTHNSDGSWDLAVSLPSDIEKPFFHISTHPVPILGALHLPIDSSILGSYTRMLQPSLPKGPSSSPEIVGSGEPKWAALIPVIKGKMYLATYKPKILAAEGEKAVADGVNFPALVPWKLGSVLEDVDINFGEADWY
ncbi:hypothetical protein GYMLUDRAFT_36001 [Collybiopsis luxurians FD-317 M1]|nr:hypothetical protein GYMLUDRAFT_36001 [Collybiopsis luxurians FD-317 M1]